MNPFSNIIPDEENTRLWLHLSSPEKCSRAQEFFDGLFYDVSVRSANVIKSLRCEHSYAADFLHRMYLLSPEELRSRKNCGHKTFSEISDRLLIFRQHMRKQLPRHLSVPMHLCDGVCPYRQVRMAPPGLGAAARPRAAPVRASGRHEAKEIADPLGHDGKILLQNKGLTYTTKDD